MKKLCISNILKEGVLLGTANFLSIVCAQLLYLLTIWIPYLNVGTTIAMQSIPVELAKGKVISPLFIFKSEYRRNMGEYFILSAIMLVACLIGLFFGVIPMYVIMYAWSLAVYLFVDKDMTALDALHESNRLTYGNKWRIFAIGLILSAAIVLTTLLFVLIGNACDSETLMLCLILLLCLFVSPLVMGCNAMIYKTLTEGDAETCTCA
ncbi:MAG: hypothetical protein NC038_00785 [Paludibacter sp.]|nr:hypothetical protein [Bacteroidales bacterium]MCM1068576.1 hypothetical protein [Prevotella sp.]MCM1353240.1 hypothetical protein [Bacteroides sp.]MCM1442352.1 hypothetical protein [Muribaculum sp.]MCM1481171.1 hypothetical protein [Paludibacter sp.]